MVSFRNFSFRLRAITATAIIAAGSMLQPAAAAPDAIGMLVGAWGGSGRINYTDGTSEGISCTAYYTGGARELTMAIQCRSDKNPIHIRSRLNVTAGRVSGSWEERTFNASGSASGSIGSSSLRLNVSGGGFTGTMAVAIRKSTHSVTVETQGVSMKRATMNFRKRQ